MGAAPALSSQPIPAGTPPGGVSLAARLIQNRTKTGKQKVLEADGGTPGPAGSPPGAFDLMEVTAVGGAPEAAPTVADGEVKLADGGVKGTPGSSAPARRNHPTPGGGLPGLLARTQLGLGEAIRSFRETGGRTDAPVSLQPLRPTSTSTSAPATPAPTGMGGFESGDPTTPGSLPAAEVAGSSGSVVAAGLPERAGVSGPVFDLATGPAAGSGPVSGPIFDLVSGPLSGPTTNAGAPEPASTAPEQAAPRQSSSSPASGRLAALLAESRKRTGRHDTLDPVRGSANSLNEDRGEPASASAPVEVAPTPAPVAESSPSDSGPQFEDVATIRVPGAALAQQKGPGFAATLLGLPTPDLVAQAAAAREGALTSAAASIARERPVGGTSQGGGTDRNAPLPVDGDATERSLLSTADVRAGWRRNSEEQRRTTDIIDVVRPNRSGIKTGAAILGGAAVVVVILVSVARVRRSASDERPTAATARTLPAAVQHASEPQAPSELAPGAGRTAEEARRAAVNAGEVPTGEAPAGEARRIEAEAAPPEEKPAAPAVEDSEAAAQPLPSAFRATGSSSTARPSETESKRKAAHSEARRSDARRSEPKARRRNVEPPSTRAEGAATAAAFEAPVVSPRPRAQPLRGVEVDPDATLPLGTR